MASTPSHNAADQLDGSEGDRGPYLRIHAVNVYVRDQDRSLQFYVDKLGFDLTFDGCLPTGQRWVAVAPRDGGTVLALIAPKTGTPEHKLIGRATQVVFVTEDVVSKFRDWSKRGVRFRHAPRLRRVKFDRSAGESLPPIQNPWNRSRQSGAVCSRDSKTAIAIPSPW